MQIKLEQKDLQLKKCAQKQKRKRSQRVPYQVCQLLLQVQLAAPFTGGASLIAGAAAGLTATIGATTIVVSATELAILVGGVLGSLAIMAGFKKITFNKDGSVIMDKE